MEKNITHNTDLYMTKFFGAYVGQTVHVEMLPMRQYLKLRPLSHITDNELVELAEFLQLNTTNNYKLVRDEESIIYKGMGKDEGHALVIRNNFYDCTIMVPHKDRFEFKEIYLEGVDWLRSKGFALPYMGESVETMIDWGWLELID